MAPPRRGQGAPPRPSNLSEYSDESSSYWPPGWNFDRFAHATEEDVLSDEERAKMRAGLLDVLGEDGVDELARALWQEKMRLKKLKGAASLTAAEKTPPSPPGWLVTWKKYYRGKPWGFVAFRTADHPKVKDPLTTKQLVAATREIVELPFDAALEEGQSADDVAEARKTFEIRWVQIEDLIHEKVESKLLEKLRARYRAMRESGDLPFGFDLPLFLYASVDVTAYIITLEKPTTSSQRMRLDAPVMLAVAAEGYEAVEDEEDEEVDDSVPGEKDWFKDSFKVAAEVLVDELWPILADSMFSLPKLTMFVRRVGLVDYDGQGKEEVSAGEADENRDDDGLVDVWWSVYRPPKLMRKRRRFLAEE